MKKILMAFELAPTDNATTAAEVEQLLGKLGEVGILLQAEMEVASAEGLEAEYVIYISGDESVPYLLVDGVGEREGDELEEEELEDLQTAGVCVAFHAEYPRADQYDTPTYAVDGAYAQAEVAEHQFRVAAEGLSVTSEDRGDDSPAEIWLTVLMPE